MKFTEWLLFLGVLHCIAGHLSALPDEHSSGKGKEAKTDSKVVPSPEADSKVPAEDGTGKENGGAKDVSKVKPSPEADSKVPAEDGTGKDDEGEAKDYSKLAPSPQVYYNLPAEGDSGKEEEGKAKAISGKDKKAEKTDFDIDKEGKVAEPVSNSVDTDAKPDEDTESGNTETNPGKEDAGPEDASPSESGTISGKDDKAKDGSPDESKADSDIDKEGKVAEPDTDAKLDEGTESGNTETNPGNEDAETR